ncbi:MAG TPA: hypothetical protein VJ208_01870 [Candidatus Nanoarchaeia archaeon]|nr:hypothetical protein [Candidatus Nanoarchaeia archaeon]
MKNCPEIVQIKMSNLDQTNDDIKKVEENDWIFFEGIRNEVLKKYGGRYNIDESCFREEIGKMAGRGTIRVIEGTHPDAISTPQYFSEVKEGYHIHILSYKDVPIATSIGIEDKNGRINFMRFSNVRNLEKFLRV